MSRPPLPLQHGDSPEMSGNNGNYQPQRDSPQRQPATTCLQLSPDREAESTRQSAPLAAVDRVVSCTSSLVRDTKPVASSSELDMKTLNLTYEQATELIKHDKQIKELLTKSVKGHVEKQTVKLKAVIAEKEAHIARFARFSELGHINKVKEAQNAKLRDDARIAAAASDKMLTEQRRNMTLKDEEIRGLKETISSQEEEIKTVEEKLASITKPTTAKAHNMIPKSGPPKPRGLAERGLLYEGSDFDAWTERMNLILRVRNHVNASCTCPECQRFTASEVALAISQSLDEAQTKTSQASTQQNRMEVAKHKLVMNQRDVAMAKLRAVEAAVQKTPEKSVQEVWEVASKARPIPVITDSDPSATAETLSSAIPQPMAHPKLDDATSINILCAHISPALSARIPDSAKESLDEFWKFLPDLARPFRFLDLAVALRKRIYGFHFYSLMKPHTRVRIRQPLPQLLSVNKEIRQETRPIWFGSTMFVLDFSVHSGSSVSAFIRGRIQRWLDDQVRDDARHLSDVAIYMVLGEVDCQITCTFSDDEGLGVSFQGVMTKGSFKQMEGMAEIESSNSKRLRLRGEAIGLILLGHAEFWDGIAHRIRGY